MGNSLVELDLVDLAMVYGLILLVAALSRLRGVGQERALLWSTLRMTVQLLAVGYLLHYVFALSKPWLVVLILLVMNAFALQVVAGRVKKKLPNFNRIMAVALTTGCGLGTIILCHMVIGITPWYEPRYLIPLAGMIIGNSLTGASLASERLMAELCDRRDEIETALCFGATAATASREAVRNAFTASMTPSLNAMAAMGVVFLPGMMTGQILSGTSPSVAVTYQIAVMCAITASVAISSLIILHMGVRASFTAAHQYRI